MSAVIPTVLHLAAVNPVFRGRLMEQAGTALAEEGFILSDDEMYRLRGMIEPLAGLPERPLYERIAALSRMNPR
jgi:hypothetical protein